MEDSELSYKFHYCISKHVDPTVEVYIIFYIPHMWFKRFLKV